ncbi:MAG: WHG domain-containing protein [Armatimonadetes bacterium]|nr:WHG domain-containing protein [Anaerolineae bacterium]
MNDGSASSPYQAALAHGQHALTDTILALALDMLLQDGVSALSMRRLAQAAGCSTTVLYTLFGAKNGIIDALYLEGFRRLGAAQAALPASDDPVQRILDLCRSYRQVALANPAHYAIMFGGALRDFTPSAASKAAALGFMQPLIEAVQAALAAGLLSGQAAESFGVALWSVAHGFVSLELAGMHASPDHAEALYIATVRRLLAE